MLTRRHFRIKVMQSVYSFMQNEENDLQNDEENMDQEDMDGS